MYYLGFSKFKDLEFYRCCTYRNLLECPESEKYLAYLEKIIPNNCIKFRWAYYPPNQFLKANQFRKWNSTTSPKIQRSNANRWASLAILTANLPLLESRQTFRPSITKSFLSSQSPLSKNLQTSSFKLTNPSTVQSRWKIYP